MIRLPNKIRDLRNNRRVRKNKYKKDSQSAKYYGTRAWRDMRAHILMHRPLCEICLSENRITPATEVHHILPFLRGVTDEQRWKLLLDESNLIPVCRECHQLIHKGFYPAFLRDIILNELTDVATMDRTQKPLHFVQK